MRREGRARAGGLDGGPVGEPLSEGLRGRGLHFVVTQVVPAGGGPNKERSSYTDRCWSEALGVQDCLVFYDVCH